MSTTQVEVNVREEVRRGAALLDREMPGWDEKINLATLQLNNCEKCVLGQLYEWYGDGLERLGIERVDEVAYGFYADESGVPWDERDHQWEHLTEEWRDLIASRR